MKKVLAVLLIIIGLVCIGGSFLLPKEEDTVLKKDDNKGEILTPPEKKDDGDDAPTLPADYDYYERYKFDNHIEDADILLEPGTYTIDNLSGWLITAFMDDISFKPLGTCKDGSKTEYVDEEDVKNAFEKTFGKGTYKVFDLSYVCKPIEYNSSTKRYEQQCLDDPCGMEIEYDYKATKLSEDKVGENTVIVEEVKRMFDDELVATYHLTYTLRTKDAVFVSLKVEKI